MARDYTVDKTEQEFKDIVFDVKYDKEQFKDPETIGLLLYRLSRERQKTNHIYSEILKELEQISNNLSSKGESKVDKAIMSDIDQEIIDFVKVKKTTDAEELRKHFGYKGKNAASARLNSLYNRGLLKKARAGKKVKYWVG